MHASCQIIEIPAAPVEVVEVVEHRFMARHCGVCGRREFARPDLFSQVQGQSRLVKRVKDTARESASDPARFPVSVRRKPRQTFEKEAEELARPYCRSALPPRLLTERLIRH
jgi:hypothetical protein